MYFIFLLTKLLNLTQLDMATDQEIIDAKVQVNDNVDLNAALVDLAAIFAGSGVIELSIKRDGVVFDFKLLKAALGTGNANEDTMISDVEASILTSIGATDVVAGSIRKGVKDLVVLHDADIAAT